VSKTTARRRNNAKKRKISLETIVGKLLIFLAKLGSGVSKTYTSASKIIVNKKYVPLGDTTMRKLLPSSYSLK
jgi:hypothetical protein